jgi:hypothetical protein
VNGSDGSGLFTEIARPRSSITNDDRLPDQISSGSWLTWEGSGAKGTKFTGGFGVETHPLPGGNYSYRIRIWIGTSPLEPGHWGGWKESSDIFAAERGGYSDFGNRVADIGNFYRGGSGSTGENTGGEYIIYNGTQVNWYAATGTLIASYNATSGLPDYQNTQYQGLRDKGPIPAGSYTINLSLNPERFAKINPVTGETLGGAGIEKIPESYTTEDGNTYTYPGWGTLRAALKPDKGNNTFGRSAFYIHNSHKGYSHGCIEVGTGFFDRLIQYSKNHKSIKVIVSYPSNNSSTYGGTYRP